MFEVLQAFEPVESATLLPGYATESTVGNVKYTDGSKYELHAGDTLTWKMLYPWRGPTVDGMKVFEYYRAKWRDPTRTKEKRRVGAALQQGTRDQLIHWARGGLIWVLSPGGQFYSHIPKVDRFHHSSFLGGKDVTSAGMWLAKEGKLLELAPLSGHYKPNLGQFMNGVLELKKAIKGGRTKLFLWSCKQNSYQTLDFEFWTKLTWQEIYDDFRVNPDESRHAAVPAAPGNLNVSQDRPMYAEPGARESGGRYQKPVRSFYDTPGAYFDAE